MGRPADDALRHAARRRRHPATMTGPGLSIGHLPGRSARAPLRPCRHGDRLPLSVSTLIRHFLAGRFPAVPGLAVGVVVPSRPALLVPPIRAPLTLPPRRDLARNASVHIAPVALMADHERPLAPLAPTPKPNATSPLQTASPPGSTSRSDRENLCAPTSVFPGPRVPAASTVGALLSSARPRRPPYDTPPRPPALRAGGDDADQPSVGSCSESRDLR